MGLIDTAASIGLASILDKAGFGASKKITFFLTNISLQNTKELIKILADNERWGLISEEQKDNYLVIVLQVGQWGFKISGSQRLAIVAEQQEGGVEISAASKSTMGQVVDWGANQKNLEKLRVFLTHPQDQIPVQPIPEFQKSKSTINYKFWIVLIGIFLIFFLIRVAVLISTAMKVRTTTQQFNEDVVKLNNELEAMKKARECMGTHDFDKVAVAFESTTTAAQRSSLLAEMKLTGCEKCTYDWLQICNSKGQGTYKLSYDYEDDPRIMFITN